MNDEKNTVSINNYKALCCAAIQAEVEDFCDGKISEQSLYNFIYGTLWVRCLNIDLDYLYQKSLEKRRKILNAKERKKQNS